MPQEPSVIVDHAAKKFAKRLSRSMYYGMHDVLCDMVGKSTRPDQLRDQEFWAVEDASLELAPGETLGIVGPNGSGKSTLLKMLNGIIFPDKGRIRIRGRVGALIEVGAGFHPMLTGRENIFVNGSILGMSRKEIRRKFDQIVSFADIGDFLDVPVKNYSSGMYVRLGFAVAAHCEPSVLLVDEVLSVGDIGFQRKCYKYFEDNVLNKGVTLILVSHSVYAIARMCSKGLLLNRGKQEYYGDTAGLTSRYFAIMRGQTGSAAAMQAGDGLRPGAGELRLDRIELVSGDGRPLESITCGDSMAVRLVLRATRDFDHIPSVVLKIMDQANTLVSISQVPHDVRQRSKILAGMNTFTCRFEQVNLIPGTYVINVKIGGGSDLLQDNVPGAATLQVEGTDALYQACEGAGLLYLPAQWSTSA